MTNDEQRDDSKRDDDDKCDDDGLAADGPFFSTAEVAAYLGVHEKQIYRLMKRGGLPGTRVTGKWLFPKALIDRFIIDSARGDNNSADSARAIVIAGDDDPLTEAIAATWSTVDARPLARVPATMEHGLLLFARGVVDGVVVEHAADGCRGSVDRQLRRVLGPLVDARELVRVRLGRRDVGVVGRDRYGLEALTDRRVVVREIGVASRTLVEHHLLRAGADPAVLLRHPTARHHRAALEQVVADDVDAAIAPIAEARAMGLQGTVLATLELSLLVTRTVAERELKHLGVVVGGTVASILGRTPCIDLTGVGTITAIA